MVWLNIFVSECMMHKCIQQKYLHLSSLQGYFTCTLLAIIGTGKNFQSFDSCMAEEKVALKLNNNNSFRAIECVPVCLFPNSSKTVEANELDMSENNPLDIEMVLV